MFRNGRWRSQWSVTFPQSGGGTAEITGILKVQVSVGNYYLFFPIKINFLGTAHLSHYPLKVVNLYPYDWVWVLLFSCES